jgi:Arc/MetJ-type ribon-helix-helix transcriptional regulator
MSSEHFETLSISLPAFFVHFIDDYITTYQKKSPSQVIQDALQLLRDQERKQMPHTNFDTEQQDQELELAYRDAVQEFDSAWEITTLDGLSNETW